MIRISFIKPDAAKKRRISDDACEIAAARPAASCGIFFKNQSAS
jgi:hypothetical protein